MYQLHASSYLLDSGDYAFACVWDLEVQGVVDLLNALNNKLFTLPNIFIPYFMFLANPAYTKVRIVIVFDGSIMPFFTK